MSQVRYLDKKDIAGLSSPITFEELIERFGKSTRADSYAIGWPKKGHEKLSNKEKWKRGYWFFYKLKENGRPERPTSLAFIASLPKNFSDTEPAWLDLLPSMVVVWPQEYEGKSLLDVYR